MLQPIERRSFPRPPLWLNLFLLIAAGGIFAAGWFQRSDIDRRTALLFRRSANNPADLNRFRDELASMKLTQQQLDRELDARMDFLRTIQSEQFYIAVDVQRQKFSFRFGDTVAREADALIGGRVVKGAFSVRGKDLIDGRYVIVLQHNQTIGSTEPASIVVPQSDLAAIWPRISTATKVFIF
jgi:hypothetical protein